MTPYEALYASAVARQTKREQAKADPHLARSVRKFSAAAGYVSSYEDPLVSIRASALEELAFAALGMDDR